MGIKPHSLSIRRLRPPKARYIPLGFEMGITALQIPGKRCLGPLGFVAAVVCPRRPQAERSGGVRSFWWVQGWIGGPLKS